MALPSSRDADPVNTSTGVNAAAVPGGCDEQYDINGVDLSLLRMNMRLTPEERVRRAERARRSALRVAEIGRASRRGEEDGLTRT